MQPTLNVPPDHGGQAADAVFALQRPELYLPETLSSVLPGLTDAQRPKRATAHEAEHQRIAGLTEFYALTRRFGPQGMRADLQRAAHNRVGPHARTGRFPSNRAIALRSAIRRRRSKEFPLTWRASEASIRASIPTKPT